MNTEFTLHSLSSIFIPYERLSADWHTYRKEPERYIQRFISINSRSFRFLGVTASYQIRNYQCGLLLSSSQYIGAAPLLSPITGKPAYDLNVTPMYGENIGQVISLLGERLDIEYAPMKLMRPMTFRIPIYFSCIQYMKTFNNAIKTKWTKFDIKTAIENRPNNSTDWGNYARNSFLPGRRFTFANVKSFHSSHHKEWLELTSLLKNVVKSYKASHPPIMVKSQYVSLVSKMQEYIRCNPSEYSVTYPLDKPSDPPMIKELKAEARRFLLQENDGSKAWRIEIAVLFERFVQHVIDKAAQRGGWHCNFNEHFVISNPSGIHWALRYIEPDIVLSKDSRQWVIDAKYKSHMYNKSSKDIDVIKSSFRDDYHQVLAYTSFSNSNCKQAMIVYPYSSFNCHRLVAKSQLTGISSETLLIGLPFTTGSVENVSKRIAELLNENEQ